jgi:outer membrane lipopolysaccharide assembly protein LptE/RlpB
VRPAAALVLLVWLLAACGYHAAGRADLLPPNLRTIAIPAFHNSTVRYKLTDWMPEALAREFISHTRYRVVSDPARADMVLQGAILNYSFNPTIFDPQAQRANVADLRVTLQVTLTERSTGRVLFQRPRLEIKESYQISPDASEYFEESDLALRRASRRVAQQVVTSILESF